MNGSEEGVDYMVNRGSYWEKTEKQKRRSGRFEIRGEDKKNVS